MFLYAKVISKYSIENMQVKLQKKMYLMNLEISMLRSENEVLNNLRKHSFSQARAKQRDMLASLNDGIQFESFTGQMEANLNTFDEFIAGQSLDTAQKAFLSDWSNIMYTYVLELQENEVYWRKSIQTSLENVIFKKLKNLQNPSNCSEVKTLICSIQKSCGLGCVLHHFAYCLISAMALNRTLVLQNRNSIISEFQYPLSITNQTCQNMTFDKIENWILLTNESQSSTQHIQMPIIDKLEKEYDFLPLAIPEQLRKDLKSCSDVPFLLFLGYIIKFIVQPSESLKNKFREYRNSLGLHDGDVLVGVHVRRTDKIVTEAKYHSLEEYMQIVDKIYDRIDMHERFNFQSSTLKVKRNVYLATDDPGVWFNETNAFVSKGYRFYGNASFAKNAHPKKRKNLNSKEETLMDIWMLSLSDYLVCTFSSQICRLAYELMQVTKLNGLDMSMRAYSLDDVYYFGGQVSVY